MPRCGAIGRRWGAWRSTARSRRPDFADAVTAREFTSADRVGKLLLLGTDGPTVGLHFGMTGRLVLDGAAPIERLDYCSRRDDRVGIAFASSSPTAASYDVNDPRRLGPLLDRPDVTPLGPDLFDVTRAAADYRAPPTADALKAVLLDQHAIAGLGNMFVDELLWQCGLDPRRMANTVTTRQIGRLHAAMVEHLPAMLERGGSHTGTLSPEVRASRPTLPARRPATSRRPGRRANDGVVRLPSAMSCHSAEPTMPRLPFTNRSAVALVAVGDPGRDRTMYATILLLVAIGFALILLAVWLLRTTRPDPEVLAPLERMSERKWRRADPMWQRRHLDELRPSGAEPLEPASAPPATDAEFERGPQAGGFDDLVASGTASVAVASGLPAPSEGEVAVDSPIEIGGPGAAAEGHEVAVVPADNDRIDDVASSNESVGGEEVPPGEDDGDDTTPAGAGDDTTAAGADDEGDDTTAADSDDEGDDTTAAGADDEGDDTTAADSDDEGDDTTAADSDDEGDDATAADSDDEGDEGDDTTAADADGDGDDTAAAGADDEDDDDDITGEQESDDFFAALAGTPDRALDDGTDVEPDVEQNVEPDLEPESDPDRVEDDETA